MAWDGAATVPDLALKALLFLNRKALFDLTLATRLLWIQQLPQGNQVEPTIDSAIGPGLPPAMPEDLTGPLLLALAEGVDKLDIQERVALMDRFARTSVGDRDSEQLRLVVLSALFSTGETKLEATVRQHLCSQAATRPAPAMAFGHYLNGLAQRDPSCMEREARYMLELAQQGNGEPEALAWGIGNVVLHGTERGRERAVALLRDLRTTAPYRDHARMIQLCNLFKISQDDVS